MKKIIAFITLLITQLITHAAPAAAEEKWEGVDVAVIEKTADEQGRGAIETIFNSLEGDVLLLAFLLGGLVGGVFIGYNYRKLTEKNETGK